MRIIKHGDRNELKEFYFKCGNCGCCFVANVCECSVHFYTNEIYHTCRCPECQTKVHESGAANVLKEVD